LQKYDQLKTLTPEVKTNIWKGMFFRAQAGMERYMVTHYGYGAIDEWIDFSAEVSAKQSDRYKTEGTVPFTENLHMIMSCWDSEVKINEITPERSELEVSNCGILAYRQNAREMGIELTFDDPCREYCTRLLSKIAEKQNLNVEFELKPNGCIWKTARQVIE
jgi:hypothetical protein